MNIIRSVSKDLVYSAWLQSELFHRRSDLSFDEIELILHPDISDIAQNKKRAELLQTTFGRGPLVNELPDDIIWFEGEIREEDIEKMYVLPVIYWYLDSGKTFKLTDIPDSLKKGRGVQTQEGPILIDHFDRIEKISTADYSDFGKLILASSSEDGPYTIIDGTHRAVLLYKINRLVSQKVFLGTSSKMTRCVKSIEREDLTAWTKELEQKVLRKELW
jgi:hypothetical protein